MISVRNWVRLHPLLAVLAAAMAVRLLAVIWSQGFIHSDDHFDTISVAWDWSTNGLWGADGWLRWKHKGAETIGRFPLYTLFLLAQMKLCQWAGITSLSPTMFGIRLVHALLSLLPVWAAFRIARSVTGSVRWAAAAGLIMAFHFALPFLGVRNLIEMVGGSLWLVSLAYFYCYREDHRVFWLYLAGLMTGLAWMIRFQIAFAVLPVPFLIWWEMRSLRPVVHYAVAVTAMLVISGLTDWLLLGKFAGSTITNLTMNAGLDALYNTIPLLYLVLLVLLLVPPISLALPFLAIRPGFIREHTVLFWSSASFVLLHSLHSNQQERFIFPIVPALVVLGLLSVWHNQQKIRPDTRLPRWLKLTAWSSLAVNLILAGFFTFAYSHKGMIEPLRWLEKNAPSARVMFLQPEVKRWVPVEYAGQTLKPFYVRDWEALKRWPSDGSGESLFDCFVVYPKTDTGLPACLDSLVVRFGALEPVFQVSPSYFDESLHRLNPGHNDNFAAFIYRPKPANQ